MSVVMTSYHDGKKNTLHIVCPVLPSSIMVSTPDVRGRKVYSARVREYVPKEVHDGKEEDKASARQERQTN